MANRHTIAPLYVCLSGDVFQNSVHKGNSTGSLAKVIKTEWTNSNMYILGAAEIHSMITLFCCLSENTQNCARIKTNYASDTTYHSLSSVIVCSNFWTQYMKNDGNIQ